MNEKNVKQWKWARIIESLTMNKRAVSNFNLEVTMSKKSEYSIRGASNFMAGPAPLGEWVW